MDDISKRLQEPFAAHEIRWRVGQVSKKGDKATLLAYIDSRAAMDRLDDAVGCQAWSDSYSTGADGGVICKLSLLVEVREGVFEWVSKEDAAENTQIESVKGGVSDAFKRVAVKWGIGRYLYRIESSWHTILDGWANGKGIDISDRQRGHVGWVKTPELPSWALPAQKRKETTAESQSRRGKHDLEWENGGRARFMAALSDMGVSYDEVSEWSMRVAKAKPSEITEERRRKMLDVIREKGIGGGE